MPVDTGVGITMNAIVLVAGYVGLAVGPLMWKAQYQPRSVTLGSIRQSITDASFRNRVPWIIISVCVFAGAILLLTLRTMLHLENKRRDREPRSSKFDEVYVNRVSPDGTVTGHRVEKVCLPLSFYQLGLFHD